MPTKKTPTKKKLSIASSKPRPGPVRAKIIDGPTWQAEVPGNPVLSKIDVALIVMLAIATFAVYSRTARNSFVNFDDPRYVSENRHVQQGLNRDTLRWAFTTTEEANWHPLTWLSHALDCQLFGLIPAGHHLTNALLHVMNTVLLFLILWRATGATGRSLFVAALFALHPMNVESVAWIAERKNVLSMLFFLLTLGAYGWYVRKPNVARYSAMAVLFALGLASKPMIVTLPFVLLLLDFWPLRRASGWSSPSASFPVSQAGFWKLALEKVPLIALAATSSIITMTVQHGAMERGVPLMVRFTNAVYSYVMYLVRTFWPLHLAVLYPYEGYRLSGWVGLLCGLVLAGISFLIWHARSRPYLVVGWLWFLGTLVPMIGLVQVGDQGMADRYAYLPLIGIFVMLVWWGDEWARSRQVDSRWRSSAAGIVLAVLAVLTWRQIGTWKSSYALWTRAVEVTKDNYAAENYLGEAILLTSFQSTGQRYSEEAAVHFRNAVRLNPRDAMSRLNLGADLHEHGHLQEAVSQYMAALQLTQDPQIASKALMDLGAAYREMKEYKKSRECYLQAMQLDPGSQVIFMNLGKLAMEERIDQLAAGAAAHPSPESYLQLGQVQQAAGELSEARTSYELALKLNPTLLEAKSALSSLGTEPGR